MCSTSGELPTSYFLTGVEIDFGRPRARGGGATIYGGTFRDRQIAARDIMLGPRNHNGLVNSLCSTCEHNHLNACTTKVSREAVLHAQLHHSNLLPFLGIHREPLDGHILLISPFMSHGTATEYLRQLDEHKRAEALPQIVRTTAIYNPSSSDIMLGTAPRYGRRRCISAPPKSYRNTW